MLSARIKAGMLLAGVSVGDMVKLFGITDRTWRNWLRDPENNITVGRLQVIAKRLGIAPGTLLEDEA